MLSIVINRYNMAFLILNKGIELQSYSTDIPNKHTEDEDAVSALEREWTNATEL